MERTSSTSSGRKTGSARVVARMLALDIAPAAENSKDPAVSRPRALRALLGLLSVYALFIGATAAFAPRAFYDDFPFLAHWVDRLPPYNEHLVTDVGGLYLGFAVLFGWAAWKCERTLSLAAASAFFVVALLHVIFHATHLENFGTADAVAEVAGLAALLLPLPLVIWLAREP